MHSNVCAGKGGSDSHGNQVKARDAIKTPLHLSRETSNSNGTLSCAQGKWGYQEELKTSRRKSGMALSILQEEKPSIPLLNATAVTIES